MDKLIYCNDLDALKEKLKKDGYYDEELKRYIVPYFPLPIRKNGNTSLTLAKKFTLDLDEYQMLEDLGTYEDMLADDAKHAKYKSVYPYDVPIEYTDENGDKQTYMRPFKIGEFA